MNRSRQLARERLERDILTAIREAAANHAAFVDDGKVRLDCILRAEHRIADTVADHLCRHWKVTERARGERTAS